jgi:hypothetical protein
MNMIMMIIAVPLLAAGAFFLYTTLLEYSPVLFVGGLIGPQVAYISYMEPLRAAVEGMTPLGGAAAVLIFYVVGSFATVGALGLVLFTLAGFAAALDKVTN